LAGLPFCLACSLCCWPTAHLRKEALCHALCARFAERATSDAMFKIVAVAVIGILVGIGFFDLGQEAYTFAALLLGIGALLDYSRRAAAPRH
jgi:hypothetical protein